MLRTHGGPPSRLASRQARPTLPGEASTPATDLSATSTPRTPSKFARPRSDTADSSKNDLTQPPGGTIATTSYASNAGVEVARPATTANSSNGGAPAPAMAMLSRKTAPGTLGAREIRPVTAQEKIENFYDFGAILGKGGYGTVAKVTHAKTFQLFAGKVLKKKTLKEVEGAEEAFRRVMEIMLNHEHNNLVKTVNVFEDKVHYYIVMDICPGGTLREFIKACGQVDDKIVEDVVDQMLAGLGHLHGQRMLHRDISANNVMLSSPLNEEKSIMNGEKKIHVQLVDFDLCAFVEENSSEVRSAVLEGTYGYMAPEVMKKRKWTPSADIFALGGVLYFMLKREVPCSSVSDEDPESMSDDRMQAVMDQWLTKTQLLCDNEVMAAHPKGVTLDIFRQVSTESTTMPRLPKSQPSPGAIGRPNDVSPPTASTTPSAPSTAATLPAVKPVPRGTIPRSTCAAGAAIVGQAQLGESGSPVGSAASDVGSASPSGSVATAPARAGAEKETSGYPPVDARLWRLLSWCLQKELSKRPANVERILESGLVHPEVYAAQYAQVEAKPSPASRSPRVSPKATNPDGLNGGEAAGGRQTVTATLASKADSAASRRTTSISTLLKLK